MHFHIMENHFKPGEYDMTASVEFAVGATSGKQRFKAKSFGQLVKDVESFIESL